LIDKNMQNYDGYIQILEMQHDINIEKGNENKSLDEAIKKRKDEVKQLEEKIEKEGDSNKEHKKDIDYLNTEISQLEDAQTNLAGINRSLDYQTDKFDKDNNDLAKVNSAFERSGDLTDDNVKKAELWNKQLGKPQVKKVDINQSKKPEDENKKWGQPVRKVVNVITEGLSKLKFWVEGTNCHPGGAALLGEEGPELDEHGGKMALANFGLYNDLPIGTKVYTASETVDMLTAGLYSGSGRGLSLQSSNVGTVETNNNNAELINALAQQNELLKMLVEKEGNIYLDTRQVGKVMADPISKR